MAKAGARVAHLKLIQVCLALERPQPGHIVRHLKLLAWLPIFDKATLIRRDDAVEPVAVLPRGVRSQPLGPPEERMVDKEGTVIR